MTALCRVEYGRPGGRLNGDRIIRCGLPPDGHIHHEEADTEVRWSDPEPTQRQPRVYSIPPPDADLESVRDVNGLVWTRTGIAELWSARVGKTVYTLGWARLLVVCGPLEEVGRGNTVEPPADDWAANWGVWGYVPDGVAKHALHGSLAVCGVWANFWFGDADDLAALPACKKCVSHIQAKQAAPLEPRLTIHYEAT